MPDPAPVCLFVYNRPAHTRQVVEALKNNALAQETRLFIFSDGPAENASEENVTAVNEIRSYIRNIGGFREIQISERDRNLGLADNITRGITEVVTKYDKVIVLEDDIITSQGFLTYMNRALDLYEETEKVMHISGYFFDIGQRLPETFFYNQTSCWGWGTWRRAWQHYEPDAALLKRKIESVGRMREFNMDGTYAFSDHLDANISGQMKTWAVKWHASVFLRNGLCLHPGRSMVQNIGFDESGHSRTSTSRYEHSKLASTVHVKPVRLREHRRARAGVVRFNSGGQRQSIRQYSNQWIRRFQALLRGIKA